MNHLINKAYFSFLVAAAVAAAPVGLSAAPAVRDAPKVDAGKPAYNAKKERLSQTRYYTMKPFTLPLLRNGEVAEHFTLVISMEIGEEDGRAELAKRVPRLRDNMYQTLFQMVTFRRQGAPIPDVDMFKERLMKVALRHAGKDLVKGILVQQAFKQPVH